MKLELKHLVSYLPYGLQFEGKRKDWVLFDSEIKILCPVDLDGRWEIIKPILRPLSHLTKKIEVNGEKFVPMVRLAVFFHMNVIEYCHIEQNPHLILETARFVVIQKLFEWQFDIYGLIENGLAIDINTLNKT